MFPIFRANHTRSKAKLKAKLAEHPPRLWAYVCVESALLLGALVLTTQLSSEEQWQPLWLVGVLTFAAALPSILGNSFLGDHQIDATYLAMVLAVVFLGPAPAVAMAVISIIVRWLVGYPREHWNDLPEPNDPRVGEEVPNGGEPVAHARNGGRYAPWPSFRSKWRSKWQKPPDVIANLTNYAGMALVASAVFYTLASRHLPGDHANFGFYAVVAGAYAAGAILNLVFMVADEYYLADRSVKETTAQGVAPMLRGHKAAVFLAPMTAIAFIELRWPGLLAAALATYAYDRVLIAHVRLKEESQAKEKGYVDTVTSLARALDERDGLTNEHAERCVELAIELYVEARPEEEGERRRHRRLLRWIAGKLRPASRQPPAGVVHGFKLHDVGKIGIPDAILNKPGTLDEGEWALMQRHVEKGLKIVAGLKHVLGEAGWAVIACHHERWNGTGYPNGLKGKMIPFSARVFALADAYDAMRSKRPYKEPMSHEDAVAELRSESGKQFDPRLVEIFIKVVGTRRHLATEEAPGLEKDHKKAPESQKPRFSET